MDFKAKAVVGILFAAGIVATVADAKGKSRVLTSPETPSQVRSFVIRPEPCRNVASASKLADGGTKVEVKPDPACKPHFLLQVNACAISADGGVSNVCSNASVQVDGKSAAIKELWDAARPVWEKSSGF